MDALIGTEATRPHLLLVDDDRLILAMLKVGLEAAGYRVSTEESAEDAESWIACGVRPDLALVDINMPGRGGIYLARRLRELDRIPFLIFSAYGEQELVNELTEIGAVGYVLKPLDLPQLLPAIQTALARAREIEALHATTRELQRALDADRNVSVAVGLLMAQNNLGRVEAFQTLRQTARSLRMKLADLAETFIQTRELPQR